MKLRSGFVSNSSSSSFVVESKDPRYGGSLLTKSQEKLLTKYGFNDESFTKTYDVTCNQDDVIEFLVKHRIPFKAECHYEHESVIYKGGSYVYKFPNYGKEITMYDQYHMRFRDKQVDFEKPSTVERAYKHVVKDSPFKVLKVNDILGIRYKDENKKRLRK